MEEQALYKAIAPTLSTPTKGTPATSSVPCSSPATASLHVNSGYTPNATINPALARAVRDARFRRRPAVIPVASGSA
jgi:hypothetical protein